MASKLIGWDIDIKSEEEKRREIEAEMTRLTAPTTPLTVLAGVGPKTIEKMEAAGITNLEQLAAMTPEQLMEIPGIGEKMIDKIYQAVNRFYESGDTTATPPAEGAAVENTDELVEEAGARKPEASAEGTAETETTAATEETTAESNSAAETHHESPAEDSSVAVESPEEPKPAKQQEEENS